MTPGTKSWLYTLLNFFGYKSFGELVKKIDIFSLPGKVQSAVRVSIMKVFLLKNFYYN